MAGVEVPPKALRCSRSVVTAVPEQPLVAKKQRVHHREACGASKIALTGHESVPLAKNLGIIYQFA